MTNYAILNTKGEKIIIVDEETANEVMKKDPSLKAERMEIDEQ